MLYTKHAKLLTTDEATLFTVPKGFHAVINYIFIENHAGSTNTATLYWDVTVNNVPVPQVYIYDGASVAGGGNNTLGNGGGPLFVLHEEESLKTYAGSAGDIEVAVTIDLIEKPSTLINFN